MLQYDKKHLDSTLVQPITTYQDANHQCLIQPITLDQHAQTELENEPSVTIETTSANIEDNDWNNNDWNDQIPSIEIPLDEPNLLSATTENTKPVTVDSETQTDEQTHDKLSQINNKLKRALQTIKDKIHQITIEQPELFTLTNDDTLERIDQLVFAIRNQSVQINDLQNSYDQAQQEINQLQR